MSDKIEEDLTKFPSAFQMARNAIKQGWDSTKGVLQGKAFLAPPEKAAARLKACEGCLFYKESRCLQCGCYMHAKIHLELSNCPAGKWGEELSTSLEALVKKAEYVASQPTAKIQSPQPRPAPIVTTHPVST